MQLTRLIAAALLAGLPALTVAERCYDDRAAPAPASVSNDFIKFSEAMEKIVRRSAPRLDRRWLPEKRVAAPRDDTDVEDNNDTDVEDADYNTDNDGHNTDVDGNNTDNDGHNTDVEGADYNTDNDGHNTDVDGYNTDNDGHNTDVDGYNTDNDGHDTDYEDLLDCKSNEKCIAVRDEADDDDTTPICYDEKTTVFSIPRHFAVTLSNGDVTFPDGTKGNAYTNTKPIEDYYKTLDEKRFRGAWPAKASAVAAEATGSVRPTAATPASTSGTGSRSDSSSARAAAVEFEGDSAAGKMGVLGAGWVAGIMGLVMTVIA